MGREYRDQFYPSTTLEVDQDNLDLFFRFMNERHNIWHRRFIEKLPRDQWTDDPILKTTKYTNIYRELDRGTLWWLDNIGKQYESEISLGLDKKESFKKLIWQTAIYRNCNKIETFEEVGFPDFRDYDSSTVNNKFWEKLEAIRSRGDSVMTSAHLTCPTPAGYTKIEGYIMFVNDLYNKIKNENLIEDIQAATDLESIFWILRRVHCIGAFISYEIICDLMYVKAIGHSIIATDAFSDNEQNREWISFKEDDWANVGPGAIEGIRLIYPSSSVGPGKSKNIYKRMVQLRDEQHQHFERLGIKFKWYEQFTKGHLSLRSIEHSLCEFQKYWLQRHSLGKQRLKFVPDSHNTNIKNGDSLIKKETQNVE